MPQKQSAGNEPFWIDDPNKGWVPSSATRSHITRFVWLTRIAFVLIGVLISILIFSILNRTLALIWLVYCILIFVSYFYQSRKRKLKIKEHNEIRAKARDKTGASIINSAIHVAGHPLLNRDQPIVLALINDHLSIFDYETPQAIDTILLKDLTALHTVVYDDDRVPHIDIIDSAAQALQMTFSKNGKEITCLLRQMRVVRPIDWYHAIEQARYSEQTNNHNTL